MSLGLLLPAGLAALVALLLPLLLHLARRTEKQPAMFAALRWLRVRQRPRQRIRLEERLLLALRLLLLATLALLLAQPVLHGAPGSQPWVVVAPGIDAVGARRVVTAPHAEWRWLASGFPTLDGEPPAGPQPLGSLLRELDAKLPAAATLTVVVPARIYGLEGERVVLRRRVEWRVLDSEGLPTPAAVPGPAMLAVRHARPDEPALPYLRATEAAWHATAPVTGERRARIAFAAASEPIEPEARWLLWLVPGKLPPGIRAWIEAGGMALLDAATEAPEPGVGMTLWRNAAGDALVTGHAMGNGRVLQLTRALAPATLPEVLDPGFPDRLRTLFDPPPLPSSAFAATQTPRTGGPELSPTPHPLDTWVAMLVATLFLLERWLATSRRRERPG